MTFLYSARGGLHLKCLAEALRKQNAASTGCPRRVSGRRSSGGAPGCSPHMATSSKYASPLSCNTWCSNTFPRTSTSTCVAVGDKVSFAESLKSAQGMNMHKNSNLSYASDLGCDMKGDPNTAGIWW